MSKHFNQKSSTISTTLSQDATLIEPTFFQNNYNVREIWIALDISPDKPSNRTWEEYVQQLPQWDQLLIQESNIWDLSAFLKMLDKNKTILLVSDGDEKSTTGAYWNLITTNNIVLAIILSWAFSLTFISFHSKLYAYLASLSLTIVTCENIL